MAQYKNLFEVDLSGKNAPVMLRSMISEGNAAANIIGAAVFDNCEPVQLNGSCTGRVLRADGNTVALVGTIDGNTAYVTLDSQCYAIPGTIVVIVNWVSGENVTTLVKACGTVERTQSGGIIETETIPNLDELLAQIERMEEVTEAAEEAAEAVDQRIVPLENMTPTEIAYTYMQNGKAVYYSKNDTLSSTISRIVGAVDVSSYGRLYYSRRKNSNATSNAGMHFLDADGVYISGERDIVGAEENAYEMTWIDVPESAKTARFTAFSDVETHGDFALYGVSKIVNAVMRKIDIQQNPEDSGKFLGIGADGIVHPVTGGGGGGSTYVIKSVIIPAASWSAQSVTVSVAGVTVSNLVQIAPVAQTDSDTWFLCGVFCSAQASGSLTFTCTTAPTSALELKVIVWS